MSLDIIRKNTSSPFHAQRSEVSQGGEGGAYESGGYVGQSYYNNDAANAAIESFSTTIGAALSARTKEDNNKSDVKQKQNLDSKSKKLTEKMSSSTTLEKAKKIEKRLGRIGERQQEIGNRIKEYSERIKIPKATINKT